MTLEGIKIIAFLCTMPNGGDSWQVAQYIDEKQLTCQKYYIKCIDKSPDIKLPEELKRCILEREAVK